MKISNMKFLISEVSQLDRHTEPRIEDLDEGSFVPAKYEELTIQLKFIGSGDTREFSTNEILDIILQRVKEIVPEVNNEK